MTSIGPGNCNNRKAEVGFDGTCYEYCPTGWSPIEHGPICALDCPKGFAPVATTQEEPPSCIRPSFPREIKPPLQCPTGADRQYDTCYLDCPIGTKKNFNLCVPVCPRGFVESPDGLSCQAEFVKRSATVREACFANETRIAGRVCLAPCPSGTLALESNVELCYAELPTIVRQFFWTGNDTLTTEPGPTVAKVIFARTQQNAICLPDFEAFNGTCYADCPIGSTALGSECVANCPGEFEVTANQTACLRPTKKRAVVRTLAQSIGYWITLVGSFIAGIMLISFVLSLLR